MPHPGSSLLSASAHPTAASRDSNIVERAIQLQIFTRRKSALLAGSHGGGPTWASIATLLQTAKDERRRSARPAHSNSSGSHSAGRSLRAMLSCRGTSKLEELQPNAYERSIAQSHSYGSPHDSA